ncbi:hypothetical protein [Clostridium tetani]|uniref:hypothetical protein n=1 Tax=Clostridium tetani TaxID=1513 RepID=UPI0038B3FC93
MNNIDYIKLLDSNKFSLKEKKLLFIGIIFSTICDRVLFKKNNDLKQYINIYEKKLNLEPYKDYLYDCRTSLCSRLAKDFMVVDDDFIIKECFRNHIMFIKNREEFSKIKDKKKISSTNNNLLKDMINRGKKHE